MAKVLCKTCGTREALAALDYNCYLCEVVAGPPQPSDAQIEAQIQYFREEGALQGA